MRTVTYPAKGGTRHVQAPRKASVEASNLSKGEICFNLSLSISFQISKTREQDPGAPRVLEPEASSGLLQASPSRSRDELRRHHMFVMPRPICNYVLILCLFLHIYSSRGRLFFLCPASCPSYATLSRTGLLEVSTSYLGCFVIFMSGVPCCRMAAP
jgi:hypothetical protein